MDLNSNTMDLKKIETTTTLRTLPSGHVAHKLTEFAPGGWKAPTLEQTDLFQAKTDAFRPVANSVLDSQVVLCTQSAISHVPFRLTINMILTCVLAMPCPLTSSSMIKWIKEHLVSSVHLLLVST